MQKTRLSIFNGYFRRASYCIEWLRSSTYEQGEIMMQTSAGPLPEPHGQPARTKKSNTGRCDTKRGAVR